jgi:hypothetical protein
LQKEEERRKAIRGLAEKLHFGMEKVMPDSLIFAVLLTFIVFLAMVVVGVGPIRTYKDRGSLASGVLGLFGLFHANDDLADFWIFHGPHEAGDLYFG